MRPLHPNLQRALALLDVPAPSFTGDDAAERLAAWKEEVLKPAWRRAAKKYHPDTASTEADAALFQEAQEAYTMLLGVEIREPEPTPSPFATDDGLDFKVGDPFEDRFGDSFGDPFRVPFGLGGRRKRRKTKINDNGQDTAVPPPRRQPFSTLRRGVGRETSEDMGGAAPDGTALAEPKDGAFGFEMRRHANGTVEVSLQMRLDGLATAREVLAALSELLHGGPPEAPPPDVNRRAAQNLRERFVVIGGSGKKGR